MTTLDLDRLEEHANHASEAHDLATRNALLRTMSITYPELIFANHCREDVPALITECRRLREYVALLEQATGTMIQVQREASATVFEKSNVFSRPECVFKYCQCPALCQERCMLTKAPQP